MSIIHWIRKHPYISAVIALTGIGLFLRLYRLDAFVQFLGDQGRDAIILKRLITLEHLPAVGAPSSIGQVYLGPFYYYFISPWLLLSNFNPIGPAIGVALFSTLFIPVIYFALAYLFDRRVGLVTAIFVTFSATLISLSRFSWNPNLLPLFSFFAVFYLLKALKEHKNNDFIICGAFFSCSLQLHYVSLAAGPAVVILLCWYLFSQKKKLRQAIWNIVAMVCSFIIISLPLIIFDVRHSLLNVTNFIHIFTQSEAASTSRGLWEIVSTFQAVTTHMFQVNEWGVVVIAVLTVLALAGMWKTAQKDRVFIHIVGIFLVTLSITSFFTLNKYPHYFGFLYPLYFAILAYLLAKGLWEKSLIFIVTVLLLFIGLQIPSYEFFRGDGSHQIERAQKISRPIFENVGVKKYQVTSIPDHYGDSPQRYYLELWGKRPLDKDSMELADELFVMCEKPCKPIGDPQWDIAYFRPNKVVGTWKVEGVTIYKLVR